MAFPIRLLHLWAGNLYGGVESLLVTLAEQRSTCASLEPEFGLCFEGRLGTELRASGVPVCMLGKVRVRKPWTVWRARRRLSQRLRQARPDVVVCHSCWPHALFASVVRRHKLPLVFWAHDIYTGRHWSERWARRTSPDFVLATSRVGQLAAEALFPVARSEILHLPVPPAPVVDREAVRQRVRAALGATQDAVVLIQACRLERWKGHALLLDALGRLANLPGWVCWIAGGVQQPREGLYLDELKQKVRQLGLDRRVQFLGQRTDVSELLIAADVHCQPNTEPEPFGLAFVEALRAGLPVVTTALGGALEILDNSCGVLVPPGDAVALAKVLAQLIQSAEKRTKLGLGGPARGAQLCDPGHQLRQLHQVLVPLAAPKQWLTKVLT
jgi:glycosyltransferase involved in cell wall biosynthesis